MAGRVSGFWRPARDMTAALFGWRGTCEGDANGPGLGARGDACRTMETNEERARMPGYRTRRKPPLRGAKKGPRTGGRNPGKGRVSSRPWRSRAGRTAGPRPRTGRRLGSLHGRPLFAKHSILDVKENRLQPYIRTFDEIYVSVPDGICETAPHHLIALMVPWTPVGFAVCGPTSLPSRHDCLCNRGSLPPITLCSSHHSSHALLGLLRRT